MSSPVSRAVVGYISSASSNFFLHFPQLSDLAWDNCLASTDLELDAKCSSGYTNMRGYVDALAYLAAGETRDKLDLAPLRELMLSDDVLALVVVKAGAAEICSPQDKQEASRAIFVLADVIVGDGAGLPRFAVWVFDIFKGVVSVALEAHRRMQVSENSAIGRQTSSDRLEESGSQTPSKRLLVSSSGNEEPASKRRRTFADTSTSVDIDARPSTSTLQILQRLRRRQKLAATSSSGNLSIVLAPKAGLYESIFTSPTEEEPPNASRLSSSTPSNESILPSHRTSEPTPTPQELMQNTQPQPLHIQCSNNKTIVSDSAYLLSIGQPNSFYTFTVCKNITAAPAPQKSVQIESWLSSPVSALPSTDSIIAQSDTRHLCKDLQDAAEDFLNDVWATYLQEMFSDAWPMFVQEMTERVRKPPSQNEKADFPSTGPAATQGQSSRERRGNNKQPLTGNNNANVKPIAREPNSEPKPNVSTGDEGGVGESKKPEAKEEGRTVAAPSGAAALVKKASCACKVFVGNLGMNIDEAHLSTLFTDAGFHVSYALITRGEGGRSLGYGFVGVGSREEQRKAVEALEGKDVCGRTIRVEVAGKKRLDNQRPGATPATDSA